MDECQRCEAQRTENGTYCRPCLSFLTSEGWNEEAEELMTAGAYELAAERFGDVEDMAGWCHIGEDVLHTRVNQMVALLWAERPGDVLSALRANDQIEEPDASTVLALALLGLDQVQAARKALREACSQGAGHEVDALSAQLQQGTVNGSASALGGMWLAMARLRAQERDWLQAAVYLRLAGERPAALRDPRAKKATGELCDRRG